MTNADIPAYCFLTGQFLVLFDQNKAQAEFAAVDEQILKAISTKPTLRSFPHIHPGVMVMLSYALLVYPVEFWKVLESKNPSQAVIKDLETHIAISAKEMRVRAGSILDLFGVTIGAPDTVKLLRHIRNAVAHARIDFTESPAVFHFRDVEPRSGKITFEASITITNLSCFLTALGRYFGSHRTTIK